MTRSQLMIQVVNWAEVNDKITWLLYLFRQVYIGLK